jgi:hypothetical protein
MDNAVFKEIDQLISGLQVSGGSMSDPVAKLMVTTLTYQAQKIKDEISQIPYRITERLCSTFVPKNKIDAIPSISLVQPSIKTRRDMEPHFLSDGVCFSYKISAKQSLTFYPLFKTQILPVQKSYLLTPKWLRSQDGYTEIESGRKGQVWLGIETSTEIDNFKYVSFFLKGCKGVLPKRIAVGNGDFDLSFSLAGELDEVSMAEPFDSQQVNTSFIETLAIWRRELNGGEDGRLIIISDLNIDRDVFKCRAYPKVFQQFLESCDLDKFDNGILWILFDFGPDFEVPDQLEIIPNVIPVVNVQVHSVTLTQSSPIAKLTKNDGSFFLFTIETPLSLQHQGFGVNKEEFVIRDFDVSSYNSSNLYRDVRNLYNRFIDDYHAFVDYHGLKDGESIRHLREMVNRIGKNVQVDQEKRNLYDEGTYAMRNVGLSTQNATVKVSYLTTFGRLGNSVKAGDRMENRKDAALEKDVVVIASAECGEDKAGADQMYELLRYYTLTSDRLFTKMDIDAFLRMQLLKEFGKEEMKRIGYDITVQGAGGAERLARGLYIDIKFKDGKNYEKALSIALDRKLKQLITDKSCLSMPIIVTLINIELN